MKILLVWEGARDTHQRVMFRRRQVPLLRQLVADGVQPVVALAGDDFRMCDDLAGTGIPIDVMPMLPPPGSALRRLPRAVAQLRALIDRHDPDIVEASDPMPGIAAALATLGRRRAVFIYRRHFHGGRLRMRIPSQIAARLADRMIASSESMRHYVAQVERKPLRLIDVATSGIADPPAYDDAAIAAARQSLDIAADARVIGAVAYLRRQKGIDVLIRALDHLGDCGDVHLIVAGSGPDEGYLRELAARAPRPVHFIGFRDDVERWIAASDVIVMPSRGEAFGRVTLEAMAGARPLIAARVGGLPDAVVDGETGLLVPVDDVAALGAALRRLIGDRAKMQTMGAAARARFESRFTIGHMAASWRAAWERALAARHAPGTNR